MFFAGALNDSSVHRVRINLVHAVHRFDHHLRDRDRETIQTMIAEKIGEIVYLAIRSAESELEEGGATQVQIKEVWNRIKLQAEVRETDAKMKIETAGAEPGR